MQLLGSAVKSAIFVLLCKEYTPAHQLLTLGIGVDVAQKSNISSVQDRVTREIEEQEGLPWYKSYYMPTNADKCAA